MNIGFDPKLFTKDTLKLYFDKFEAEIAPSLQEPTTPEYEKASDAVDDAADDDLEGGAELGL